MDRKANCPRSEPASSPREGACRVQTKLLPGRMWESSRLLASGVPHTRNTSISRQCQGRGAGTGLDAGQTHCVGGFSLSSRQKEKEGWSMAHLLHAERVLSVAGGSLPDSRGTLSCSLLQGGAQDPQALPPRGKQEAHQQRWRFRPALLEGQGEAVGWGGRKSDLTTSCPRLGGSQPLLQSEKPAPRAVAC